MLRLVYRKRGITHVCMDGSVYAPQGMNTCAKPGSRVRVTPIDQKSIRVSSEPTTWLEEEWHLANTLSKKQTSTACEKNVPVVASEHYGNDPADTGFAPYAVLLKMRGKPGDRARVDTLEEAIVVTKAFVAANNVPQDWSAVIVDEASWKLIGKIDASGNITKHVRTRDWKVQEELHDDDA